MTLKAFHKLKLGDAIVNRRSPGIVLRVTNRWKRVINGLMTDVIEVENSAGKHEIPETRHLEYQQMLEQVAMRLP